MKIIFLLPAIVWQCEEMGVTRSIARTGWGRTPRGCCSGPRCPGRRGTWSWTWGTASPGSCATGSTPVGGRSGRSWWWSWPACWRPSWWSPACWGWWWWDLCASWHCWINLISSTTWKLLCIFCTTNVCVNIYNHYFYQIVNLEPSLNVRGSK